MCAIRVLIVEDDQDVAELVQLSLEPTYECLRARDGMQAVQMALAGEPDLIISDIMMPVMDGHEFIRRMRRERTLATTPVIFLSALGSREKIRESYDLGATLYLTKPIDPQRLRRNVDLFVKDNTVRSGEKKRTIGEVQGTYGGVGSSVGVDWLEGETSKKNWKPRSTPGKPTPSASAPASAPGKPASPPPRKPVTPAAASTADEDTTSKRIVKKESKVASALRSTSAIESKPRVLVVEDDRDSLELITTALMEKYEVIAAGDGIEAIERGVRYTPDIFIIDGMLPRMTGYQLVAMLKKNAALQKTPVIFISGKATVRDKQYVERLGVKHFLAKPFEVEHLLKVLAMVQADPDFSVNKDRLSQQQVTMEKFRDLETHRTERYPGPGGPKPTRTVVGQNKEPGGSRGR